jgi:hypothetical protein
VRAKDCEVMTAITQMWSLYFWSNASGDPINSVGFQLNAEAKQIAAAKRAARYAMEKGYYRVVQPLIIKKELDYQGVPTGVLVPQEMSWA